MAIDKGYWSKRSRAARERWANPEYKAKMLVARQNAKPRKKVGNSRRHVHI